ncbi:hypothetical protein DEA8626_02760 [Defluviimonas aquaemixtae]|uniref:Uncharacterized protein n=1 Tax=Albidovulum aquaemixtae TaxID=1542388 RepID=A0A2R8BK00_9RHOB|nr:hypothetical protein [Defluviimonas aquaemixtae]SPH23694.1 hypothetical protein DEA8626_02760 [Defluviimonas aquaemixtae]
MRHRVSTAIAAALFVAVATPASAQKVVYQGADAEKLKCAVMLSIVGEIGLREGELGAGEYMMTTGAIITLLEELPGTPAQKNQAMDRMAERLFEGASERDVARLFERDLPRCDRFFR